MKKLIPFCLVLVLIVAAVFAACGQQQTETVNTVPVNLSVESMQEAVATPEPTD